MDIDEGELKTLILAFYTIESSIKSMADSLDGILAALERIERKSDDKG